MTLGMSLICATSSLAATRGATFLPPAVEGKRMWLQLPAIVSTCAATFSARLCAKLGLSATITLATPAICAAAFPASAALAPATSPCPAPPQAMAGVTVFRVGGLTLAWSCSAIPSAAMSDHLRFVLEFFNESGHIGHLDALSSLGRLADLQGLQARLDVHAQVLGLEDVELLLLGLHDVGQGNVARLVQAQVGRDDRGQRQ